MLAHFAQVRTGQHYRSDMYAGKSIGLAVVALTKKVWLPGSNQVRVYGCERRVPWLVDAKAGVK